MKLSNHNLCKWNTCKNWTYLLSQLYCKSGFSGNISMSWNIRHRFSSISVWLLHFSCKWRFANLAPTFINLARLNNAESSWEVTICFGFLSCEMNHVTQITWKWWLFKYKWWKNSLCIGKIVYSSPPTYAIIVFPKNIA